VKEKIKEMFSGDNISLTLLFAAFIGSFVYLMVTAFSIGALMAVGIAGYAGYAWGYLQGMKRQKAADQENL
jgi:hypothetical protein